MSVRPQHPTGHVYRVERKRGPVWYAKYRLPDGRQVQRKIGAAWTERGRPAEGYYTKRAAEAWLEEVLHQARRGELPGMVRTGVTFADAAAEWLCAITWSTSGLASHRRSLDYRSAVRAHLNPAFGELPLEQVTTEMIEAWRTCELREGELSRRSLQSSSCGLQRDLPPRPEGLEAPDQPVGRSGAPERLQNAPIDFYSPEEVQALVRTPPMSRTVPWIHGRR